jgi:hypothetical protein
MGFIRYDYKPLDDSIPTYFKRFLNPVLLVKSILAILLALR